MTKENSDKKRNPWSFIPTLYFTEGVPFIIVNQMSVALLKSLDVSNTIIGLTNFLYLPWAIKFLWSPIVDSRSTKRSWTLSTQLLITVLFAFAGASLFLTDSIIPFIGILLIIAFASATHDIAIDGYYLYALDKGQQALFTGIRSAFYRVAMIFSGGVLVFFAGEIGTYYDDIKLGWIAAFALAFVLFLLFRLLHGIILPKAEKEREKPDALHKLPYKKILAEYFSQERIGVILAFILVFRFGEAMLLKMAQPFLMDKYELGGLGISVSEVGIIYGTLGIIALVIGGILGGWIVKKYGLKRTILPLAVFMHACNVLYIILAAKQPMGFIPIDLGALFGDISFNFYPLVQTFVIIEQFGYGVGFTSFMVFLLYTSKGEYKTSHFAISTGLMALGMIIPGALSGIVQEVVGYFWLFTISTLVTIPSLILIKYLPFDEKQEG